MMMQAFYQTFHSNRMGRQLLTLLAILVLLPSSLHAQPNYKEHQALPAKVANWNAAVASDEGKAVIEMLAGTPAVNPQVLDKFFKEMLFPFFTQYSNRVVKGTNLSPLIDGPPKGGPAAMRESYKRNYAAKATNAAAHDALNNVTLEFMDAVTNDNYHPVVRANAMLMIGDLNESDPNGPPWKKALPSLLKAVSDPKMIDAVRIEALRGLVRHARSGVDAEPRGQVIRAMVAIIGQHTAPAGRSQDGHDWICRRAIDVLAALGDAGANNAVPQALVAAVNDGAASISVRCAAAEALGKVKFNPPKDFDSMAVAKGLGKLAIDSVKTELTAKAPLHSPINAERLKQSATEISRGFMGGDGKSGLSAWSTDAAFQQLIKNVDAQLKGLAQACDTPTLPLPPPQQQVQGAVVVPIDRQRPIVDALNKAVDGLKVTLDRGEAGPAAAVPAGKAPDFN